MSAPTQESTQLVRGLGPFSSYVMALASVIGTGIFLVGTDIANAVPTPLGGLLVWVAAGIISVAGALNFAELGTMFPRAGGQYVFIREAFHPIISFLFGWTLVFVIQTGSIAAVAVGFARFVSKFYDMDPTMMNVVATLIIIALTLYNFLGIKRGSQFLDAITSFKLVAIIGFILLVLTLGSMQSPINVDWSLGEISPAAFGVAMVAAFWAFDGWYALTFVAGEIRDPEKNIPRASLFGLLSVLLLYALMSYSYFTVLNLEQIQKSSFVASDAAQVIAGDTGVRVMGVLVILSALGCLNSMIMSGARVVYAMAKDNVLPYKLAVVNPKNHSPNRSLTLQAVWSVLLVWSGRYDQLFTYVIFAAFIFYGLTAFAVLWLRKKRPELPRPYKVPFYPWLPGLYVVFTIVFTINSLMEKPMESLAGLGIIALGIPAHYILKKISVAPTAG